MQKEYYRYSINVAKKTAAITATIATANGSRDDALCTATGAAGAATGAGSGTVPRAMPLKGLRLSFVPRHRTRKSTVEPGGTALVSTTSSLSGPCHTRT